MYKAFQINDLEVTTKCINSFNHVTLYLVNFLVNLFNKWEGRNILVDMNRYRMLSVRAEDYDTIMNWGFSSAYTGAEVIAELMKYYKYKILAEELQSIYYASEEHKKLFEKHLKINHSNNYTKNLENPVDWIGDWNEERTMFKESPIYKKLCKEMKRLVDYANVLLYETNPLCIIKVFSYIENKNVVLAQEMLRLKLLNTNKKI